MTKLNDVNGRKIKEGNILTFDWFTCDNVIEEMRRLFITMEDWTDAQINNIINKPTFKVEKNDNGVLYGEGIDKKKDFTYTALDLSLRKF